MNIIILGAGEVGKQLAYTLYNKDNDIVVVDLSQSLLGRLKDKLDVMTVQGSCAAVNVLINAHIKNADLVIAVTGNDASNILACHIAKHFNVKTTVCRLSSDDFFAAKENYTPKTLGIDHIIFPVAECIDKIFNVLIHHSIVENISFNLHDIKMTAIKIPNISPLSGTRILDFPNRELLSRIRFSAIIRNQKLVTPFGSTIFAKNDEVYISGNRKDIDEFISYADPDADPTKMIIIAGATKIGRDLTKKLLKHGYNIRLIEKSDKKGENLLDELDEDLMVIAGDPTDGDVLDEAGISVCDTFISTSDDDEENILTCILAKKKGAGKVITITNKAEYVDIIPGIVAVDCGFSPRIAAVNSVLRLIGTDIGRIHAILQRITNTYVYELNVNSSSKICEKEVAKLGGELPAVLSFVFRNNQAIPVTGDLKLKANDQVVAISTPSYINKLESLFKKKHFILP
jgi:trk system potassium uptake protein